MMPAAPMGTRLWRRVSWLAASAVALALVWGGTASAFDPVYEAKNYSKTLERSRVYSTPAYQLELRTVSLQNRLDSLAVAAKDQERNFLTNLCASGEDGCAGDVRLYDWGPKGYGIVKPVLFTARNGATLAGHVWGHQGRSG
jgi:hypothetical protein